jgi:hypothetical protein
LPDRARSVHGSTEVSFTNIDDCSHRTTVQPTSNTRKTWFTNFDAVEAAPTFIAPFDLMDTLTKMQRPFGYFTTGGSLEEDPNEYPIVQFAMALRRQRQTIREIADALNAANFTNRAGGLFNPTQVHRLLVRQVGLERR